MKKNFILFLLILCFSSCSLQEFKYTKTDTGIEFVANGMKKRISFYDDNIVRISLLKENKEINDSSLAVILEPKQIDFTVKNSAEFTLKTASLLLKIDKESGAISFFDLNGKSYVQENNKVLPVLKDTIVLNQSYYRIKQAFKLTKEEGLYGLGQFQNGYMNYRNKDLLLVQANKISIVPLLTSTNNYGILWDNYSKSRFHDDAEVTYFTSEVADQIDYYFIGAKSIDSVIAGYRTLTGHAPMFSKKAFGYWQSKERYTSFDELHDVVKKYRENNIPIDNIVQDWRYWGDNDQWSSMSFEPEFYDNPAENIEQLHANNINLMVSIWPSVGPKTQLFKEMQSKGFLLNQSHWCGGKVYDAYNPEARDIYWKYIKEGLLKNGVDAFWMDGTEPEFSNTDDQKTTEGELLKVERTALGPIAKYLNTYALVTSQNIYQKQRKSTNEKRVFILTRSSWAGQQRNGTVTWSGDVSANYDNFKKQISAGLNFCMAGVPYWTHDIGAFFPSGRGGLYPKGIEDPAYQELYTRWFQFGAFSPIFRSHGTGTPREVWRFKDKDPMFYNALLKTMNLRYQLMPYIYSTAWKVTNSDYTLMRGLVMDFSHDKKTYEIKDQYMFGPSIMVKPVTKSMYFNNELTVSKTKDKVVLSKLDSVYLPEHKGWYDFWTNDYFKGGQIISKEFPIGIFPLYIKAGSIIPFGPKQQYVDEKKNALIEIRIYTGDDADFVFYEDEGNNYNYEKGKYNTIHFSWNEEQKKLNIGESTGSFNGYIKNKTFKIVLIEPSVEVKNDMQYRLCNYDGRAVQLELN